ncbi:MAG: Rrf2 family transcriptional regulator [Candidatus Korobacteraceae bacterium]
MLKLTKKADYGLIAVRHLAEHADLGACSAKDLAEMYGIPQEALAKILQQLAKSKLLVSQHGTNGGYVLARDPRKISALEVIQAIEGQPFMTSCRSAKGCGSSLKCTVREPLQKVGRAIETVLGNLSVWELQESSTAPLKPKEGLNGPPAEPTFSQDGRYGAPADTPAGGQVNSPTQADRLEWGTRTEDELVKIEVKSGTYTGGSNYGK